MALRIRFCRRSRSSRFFTGLAAASARRPQGPSSSRGVRTDSLEVIVASSGSNRIADQLGEDVLCCTNILHGFIEDVRPDMAAALGFDELANQSDVITDLSDAAFQYITYGKFPAHFLDIGCASVEAGT